MTVDWEWVATRVFWGAVALLWGCTIVYESAYLLQLVAQRRLVVQLTADNARRLSRIRESLEGGKR